MSQRGASLPFFTSGGSGTGTSRLGTRPSPPPPRVPGTVQLQPMFFSAKRVSRHASPDTSHRGLTSRFSADTHGLPLDTQPVLPQQHSQVLEERCHPGQKSGTLRPGSSPQPKPSSQNPARLVALGEGAACPQHRSQATSASTGFVRRTPTRCLSNCNRFWQMQQVLPPETKEQEQPRPVPACANYNMLPFPFASLTWVAFHKDASAGIRAARLSPLRNSPPAYTSCLQKERHQREEQKLLVEPVEPVWSPPPLICTYCLEGIQSWERCQERRNDVKALPEEKGSKMGLGKDRACGWTEART